MVNKLRRKWQPFARVAAPPAPAGAGGALAVAEAQAEALLEEEEAWEASEEQEEAEGKLSDEAGLVGGLRRALLRVRTRALFVACAPAEVLSWLTSFPRSVRRRRAGR